MHSQLLGKPLETLIEASEERERRQETAGNMHSEMCALSTALRELGRGAAGPLLPTVGDLGNFACQVKVDGLGIGVGKRGGGGEKLWWIQIEAATQIFCVSNEMTRELGRTDDDGQSSRKLTRFAGKTSRCRQSPIESFLMSFNILPVRSEIC